MVVIVVSGKQGSGKSTLCLSIKQMFEDKISPMGQRYEVFTLRFAQPLYEMHDAVRNILRKYNYTNYDFGSKDGNLLQLLGTEWGRQKIDDGIWVQLLLNKLRELPKNAIVTIEDCRFENEFDAFAKVPNVLFVRLEASRQIRKLRASMWRDNENHPSEIGLDHYAATGRFDLTFDTDKFTAQEVLSMVTERTSVLLQRSDSEHV